MTVRGAPAVAALLRHESRRCGLAVWALPLAGIVAGAAVVMVPPVAQPVLSVALRVALAGFAALCVVAVLGAERMWQLHLSLPVPVAVLVGRRLAIVAGSTAVAGAATAGALVLGPGTWKVLDAVASGAAGAGAVLCTAMLLSGVALWTWARWHATTAASGALIAVWLGYALVWVTNVPPVVDLPLCAVTGALLIRRGLRALNDPERVLAKEGREE